jgi:hypothetical protein
MRDDDQHTDDQWHDHLGAVERFRRAWLDGELTVADKRRLIGDENRRYYGGQVPAVLRVRGAA